MNRTKRSKHEIIRDILSICYPQANKTKVVYKANLNFKMLKQYQKKLITNGLITFQNQKLRTTQKGLQTLKTLNTLTEAI